MFTINDCHIRYHNKIYEVQFRKNGFKKSFSSKYKTKAIEKAKQFLKEITNNNNSNKNTKNKFINYATEWFNNIKRKQLKENTFNNLKTKFNKYITPYIKTKTIAQITPIELQKYFDEIAEKAPRTLEDIKSLFNQIFIYAIANNLCKINPINAVYVKKHERQKGKALSKEDEQIFLNNIKNTKYELSFKILLYTGSRPSELENINFDFENELIIIKNSKLKSYQKTLIRTLPMFPTIKNLKNEITQTTNWRIKTYTIDKFFNRAIKGYQAKDLRHTFTTKCRQEFEIPNEIVNLWQGHTQGKNLTANTYTHFNIEYQRKFANKVTY